MIAKRARRNRSGGRAEALCAAGAGFVIGAAGAAPAFALGDDDRLAVIVAEDLAYDDNVFRVAPQAEPRGGGDDYYRTTSVALKADVPIGEQRFVGNVAVSQQRFERFGVLDLDGHDASARWLWKAGEQVNGAVGYTDRLALASLANVQNGVQSATPNVLATREAAVETAYQPIAHWRLHGGWRSTEQSNRAVEFRISDANIDTLEGGLDYVTRADDRFGVALRATDGRLPNPQVVGGLAVDNSYTESAFALRADWSVTSKSHVALSAGGVDRSYAQLPQRGYTGPTYAATYSWQPAERLAFEVAANHGLSPYEEVQVGFVLARVVALRSSIGFGDRLTLGVSADRAQRTYLGDVGSALAVAPPVAEDLTSHSVTVAYRPRPKIQLAFALQQTWRVSTLQSSSYRVDVATVGAHVTF